MPAAPPAMRERIDEALSWFDDSDGLGPLLPVRRPTRAVMLKAIQYGDAQGWPEGWEGVDGADPMACVAAAVYAVDPDRLRKGARPPPVPVMREGRLTIPTGNGCLPLVAAFVAAVVLVACFI